jgi:hypothetical protein
MNRLASSGCILRLSAAGLLSHGLLLRPAR